MQNVITAGIFLPFLGALAQAQETPVAEIAVGCSNLQINAA